MRVMGVDLELPVSMLSKPHQLGAPSLALKFLCQSVCQSVCLDHSCFTPQCLFGPQSTLERELKAGTLDECGGSESTDTVWRNT